MKKYMRPLLSVVLSIIISLGGINLPALAENDISDDVGAMPFDVAAKSAVLMDEATGTVLYSKNGEEALPPASVTKVMTLLLVMEAIEVGKLSLTDTITVSDYAASMGGSQVYLEPGEEMSVEEMLKCVIISSANDAAMALAERVSGSETEFVALMNSRAKELGMNNTHFENPTGLDDDVTNHCTSAHDIAIMSRELIGHKKILEYSCIWMDTIRDGEFGLTNTNRLIRFYSGATGLKTGSTAKAGFCISATAKRGDLHLIAVVMGSDTRDERNAVAKTLLDWGFSKFSLYTAQNGDGGPVPITGGMRECVETEYNGVTLLLPPGKNKDVTVKIRLLESVRAPVKEGDRVGAAEFYLDGEMIASSDVVAVSSVERISFAAVLWRVFSAFCLK